MHHNALLYALTAALLAQAPPRAERYPTIRVLIRTGMSTLAIECRGPVEISRSGVPRPLQSLARLPASTLLLKDGRFHFGGLVLDEKWITLRARDPEAPFRLGERSYPGQLHCVAENGSFRVVNEIDFEQYVMGVVPAEIGSGAPLEAMKVQAVAARSFAVARMGGFRDERSRPVYDVVDDTRDQVYVGVPASNTNARKAVEATCGMFVQYRGKFVCTYFSSSCGGHTLGLAEWSGAAEIPPLSGVPCGFCGENAPNGTWEARVTLAQLAQKLAPRTGGKPVRSAAVAEETRSKRVASVQVETATGRVRVPGAEFAAAAGGRNTCFAIRQERDAVVLRGAGYGHGVGLCQIGALAMASKDRTFRDILTHYFPQHELAVLYGPARPKR